jgi:hypothetical protein
LVPFAAVVALVPFAAVVGSVGSVGAVGAVGDTFAVDSTFAAGIVIEPIGTFELAARCARVRVGLD